VKKELKRRGKWDWDANETKQMHIELPYPEEFPFYPFFSPQFDVPYYVPSPAPSPAPSPGLIQTMPGHLVFCCRMVFIMKYYLPELLYPSECISKAEEEIVQRKLRRKHSKK